MLSVRVGHFPAVGHLLKEGKLQWLSESPFHFRSGLSQHRTWRSFPVQKEAKEELPVEEMEGNTDPDRTGRTTAARQNFPHS